MPSFIPEKPLASRPVSSVPAPSAPIALEPRSSKVGLQAPTIEEEDDVCAKVSGSITWSGLPTSKESYYPILHTLARAVYPSNTHERKMLKRLLWTALSHMYDSQGPGSTVTFNLTIDCDPPIPRCTIGPKIWRKSGARHGTVIIEKAAHDFPARYALPLLRHDSVEELA